MSEAHQTATPDAREASMSRVSTQETVFAKLEAQKAASEPDPEKKPDVEQSKDGEEKPKKSAQERIQELAHKRKEAEAKAEAAERKAQELEARVQALQANAQPIAEAAKPMRSQFTSDDEYIEALSDYKARQAIREREEQQAKARAEAEQAEVAEQWSKRQNAAMKRLPDYADVIGASEVNIPNHVHQAILESEQGPEIAYFLALNPDEAKRISMMKPLAAIKRIASLERDLADIDAEDDAKAKPVPKVEKSKAPPPIEPIKSVPSASGGSSSSFEEYKRRRQAEKRQ